MAEEKYISLSTSTSEEDAKNQQRTAHIGVTLQAVTGNTTCCYVRIVESNFPRKYKTVDETTAKPIIFCLNPVTRFYVNFRHPEITDTTVKQYIEKQISHLTFFDKKGGENLAMMYDSQSPPEDSYDVLTDAGSYIRV